MNDFISRVFIDDVFQYSGLRGKDLAKTKAEFRKNALKVLDDTNADHVVYCHIEYSDDGEITCANFYSHLPLDDKTFCERTITIKGADYIGAVHK